ncbi:MAG TPA: response regulator [Jatrophihabitans sp.]|uniref:ATP-binding response regulator n=1 Tax=Jatrophihabitans sp. TaxID=1932789 RepID=UPI002E0B6D00|nr:response regulator [Jatrophihabitans sp.]
MSAGVRSRLARVTGWVWNLDTDEIRLSGDPSRSLGGDTAPRTMAELLDRADTRDRPQLDELIRQTRWTREPFELTLRLGAAGDSQVVELRASLAPGSTDTGAVMVGTITDRQQLTDQALLINDTLVQRLSVASMALNSGDLRATGQALGQTLVAARELMTNLVEVGGPIPPSLEEHRGVVPAASTAAAPAPVPGGPVRAVIADDTAEIRLGMRSLLNSSSDISVVGEAADGMEAVATVVELAPDLVLLDLSMPVMDGLEALAEIRRSAPDTKVVVLSGYGRQQAATQALQGGAVAYIEKGGSTRGLLEILHAQFPDRIHLGPHGRAAAEAPELPAGLPVAPEMPVADTDLLNVAIHEMRMPLVALSAAVVMLAERGDTLDSETRRELVESARQHARRLTHVVTTLSDAHVIGMQDLGQVTEIVPVADLVRTTVDESAFLTGRHPVSVITEPEAAASLVAADSRRIRQAIEALVSNAARYSDSAASIEITLSCDIAAVEIAVRDHGPGIPVWRAPELFGKFSRLDTDSGPGLGLFLTRKIARAYGGDVRLDATGPEGSTLVLRLPRLIGANV